MDWNTLTLLNKFTEDCYKLNDSFLVRNSRITSLFETGNKLFARLINNQDRLSKVEEELRRATIDDITSKLDVLCRLSPDKYVPIRREVVEQLD
jgi:hypothetical protein